DEYPHIVDFEPKMRDLYQAATDVGEVLTASVSEVTTDKTLASTQTSETGLALNASARLGPANVGGSLSHSWGETNQDVWTRTTDASRDRRERLGTSTYLSQ